MTTSTNAPLKTVIVKGRDGWEAKTYIHLGVQHGEDRVLRVDTCKGANGGVHSSATMYTVGADGTLSSRWGMFSKVKADSDYREQLGGTPKAKVTEKLVSLQHALVLSDVEALKVKAIAYYAPEAAAVPAGWEKIEA